MATDAHVEWNKDAADALRFAQQLREYHHKALWEEEKHFTWLHSIIVAAQAATLTRKAVEIEARAVVLIVLAVAGLIFVGVALRVVRREGAFFVDAQRLFVSRFNLLFPEKRLEEPAARANRNLFSLPVAMVVGKSSIRDNFQIVFLVFGVIYVALIVGVLGRLV